MVKIQVELTNAEFEAAVESYLRIHHGLQLDKPGQFACEKVILHCKKYVAPDSYDAYDR